MDKEVNNKELLEKVETLEKQMKDALEENSKLKTENEDLRGKIASVKVDSLTRQVEDAPQQPQDVEEITFDFDL